MGPIAKPEISPGTSERSNFIKGGAINAKGISKNISANPKAPNTPTLTKYLVFKLLADTLFIITSDNWAKKIALYISGKKRL